MAVYHYCPSCMTRLNNPRSIEKSLKAEIITCPNCQQKIRGNGIEWAVSSRQRQFLHLVPYGTMLSGVALMILAVSAIRNKDPYYILGGIAVLALLFIIYAIKHQLYKDAIVESYERCTHRDYLEELYKLGFVDSNQRNVQRVLNSAGFEIGDLNVYYCKTCNSVFSGITNQSECPDCGNKLFRTSLSAKEWRALPKDQKSQYKQSFHAGEYLD